MADERTETGLRCRLDNRRCERRVDARSGQRWRRSLRAQAFQRRDDAGSVAKALQPHARPPSVAQHEDERIARSVRCRLDPLDLRPRHAPGIAARTKQRSHAQPVVIHHQFAETAFRPTRQHPQQCDASQRHQPQQDQQHRLLSRRRAEHAGSRQRQTQRGNDAEAEHPPVKAPKTLLHPHSSALSAMRNASGGKAISLSQPRHTVTR